MKIVFFGTPDYVLPVAIALKKFLRNLKDDSSIVCVVTQSPKPTGREKKITYSPVDRWAHSKNIPIVYKSDEIFTIAESFDLGILASYSEIIPRSVIDSFKYGILNIHPSLLPKYRGSSPIQATITAGDVETGATIIIIDSELDHGPIISQFKDTVLSDDTTESLRKRLFERSAEVMVSLIPAYLKGKINPRSQDHDNASFTRQIKKTDAFIDPKALVAVMKGKSLKKNWTIKFIKDFTTHYSPLTVHNFIRAMQPWPVAWTTIDVTSNKLQVTRRLKILKTHLKSSPSTKLVLDEVQLEGKSPVSWKQFLQGYPKAKFL